MCNSALLYRGGGKCAPCITESHLPRAKALYKQRLLHSGRNRPRFSINHIVVVVAVKISVNCNFPRGYTSLNSGGGGGKSILNCKSQGEYTPQYRLTSLPASEAHRPLCHTKVRADSKLHFSSN
jgi:hypothetical protein